MEDETKRYVAELVSEKSKLDQSLVHCSFLLAQEIDRVQTGSSKDKMIDVHVDKPTQITTKIRIPCKEYPKVNFIGRILGQKGSNMKRLQEETGTKISIQGRGSMRDPIKEEELRKEGGKYAHLSQDLHVHIETYGNPIECHQRMAVAISEISKYLSPDYTEEETEASYSVNGAEVPVAGSSPLMVPPAPGHPPVMRGVGPELHPPRIPGHRPPPPSYFPPRPGPRMYPVPLRRGMPPPIQQPIPRSRAVGIRPPAPVPVAGHILPPAHPYAIPPRPYIPPGPRLATYDYSGYESAELTSAATEDFTSDEWAKDITTTDGNFRGKVPTIRPSRGQFMARVGAHPYAMRGAK